MGCKGRYMSDEMLDDVEASVRRQGEAVGEFMVASSAATQEFLNEEHETFDGGTETVGTSPIFVSIIILGLGSLFNYGAFYLLSSCRLGGIVSTVVIVIIGFINLGLFQGVVSSLFRNNSPTYGCFLILPVSILLPYFLVTFLGERGWLGMENDYMQGSGSTVAKWIVGVIGGLIIFRILDVIYSNSEGIRTFVCWVIGLPMFVILLVVQGCLIALYIDTSFHTEIIPFVVDTLHCHSLAQNIEHFMRGF